MLEHIADSLPMFGVSFFETSDSIEAPVLPTITSAINRHTRHHAADVSTNPAGDSERGSFNVNVVPLPISLSTRILP